MYNKITSKIRLNTTHFNRIYKRMNTLIKEFPFWTKFNHYKAQINFEKTIAMKFNSEKEIEEILEIVKEKFFKSWKEDGSIIHFQQLFKYKSVKLIYSSSFTEENNLITLYFSIESGENQLSDDEFFSKYCAPVPIE